MSSKFITTLKSIKCECMNECLYNISLFITLILTIGGFLLIIIPECDDNIFTNNLNCRLELTGIIIYSFYGIIVISIIIIYLCIKLNKIICK